MSEYSDPGLDLEEPTTDTEGFGSETDAGQEPLSYEPNSIVIQNVDGSTETITDTDGDGVADMVTQDFDGDGNADAVLVDTDGDGHLDTILRDYDDNGTVDAVGIDSNAD